MARDKNGRFKKEKRVDYRIVIAAIAGLAALGCVAMFNGINGKVLATIVGLICSLAGLSMPQIKFK